MKIAFKGFRGFGEDTALFEITPITILTGKNGSGKSTLIKLIEMISYSFRNIKSISNIFDLSIDIGNDIYGGKKNIMHSDNNPVMIIEARFEFYTDIHELHFHFEVSDYHMTISKIDLYHQEEKKRVCTWGKGYINLNVLYLEAKYKQMAYFYNLLEEYLYYNDEECKYDGSNYRPTYYNPNENYGWLDERLTHHKCMSQFSSDTYIGKETKSMDYSHQFKELMYPDKHGRYIILEIPDESISLSKEEIIDIIRESEYYEEIESYQVTIRDLYDKDYDIYEILFNKYNFEMGNFILGIDSKAYNDTTALFTRYFSITPDDCKINPDRNFEYDLSDEEGIYVEILSQKFQFFHHLSEHSAGIFEMKIIQICAQLSQVHKQSGVVNVASRSYNIFDKLNSFSSFMKSYLTKDEVVKKEIHLYLKVKLIFLDIAHDIKFIHEGNTGFIYLIKGTKEVSLIDEGSGVNNILSVLLSLATLMSISKDKNTGNQNGGKSILILEEPESNLHPNLQSKLANILVDFILETGYFLIIETHSEYLIRKIQYLVATKKIDANLISLFYFSLDYNGKNPKIDTKRIDISDDGSLSSEFGSGFFDEADNIAIELFTLKNAQKN